MLYVIHLRGTGSSETRLAAILQAGLSGTVYEEINDPDVFLLRAADLQGQVVRLIEISRNRRLRLSILLHEFLTPSWFSL